MGKAVYKNKSMAVSIIETIAEAMNQGTQKDARKEIAAFYLEGIE